MYLYRIGMATTGQSQYVLNIVELQNTVTSATGLSPAGYLSNQLVQIEQMVQFSNKQINVNVISNFDTTPIQVVAPINLSNVALTASGTDGTIGGSGTSGSNGTIATTIGTSTTNGLLEVGVNGSVALLLTAASVSTLVIENGGAATFSGPVSAPNFVTTSDRRYKENIRAFAEYETVLSNIRGVRFNWLETGSADVGLIAQEVDAVLPEAVVQDATGRFQVSYMKLVPVLVEAVKSLQARVSTLEARKV
jgi:Chaperone of endosialidase